MNRTIVVFILLIGVLSACGSQPTVAPASNPTDLPPAPTQASLPTDTAIPTVFPTAIVQPTVPPTSASAQTATVSFAADVLPILQSRCVNCHGGDRVEEGLIMKTLADIMAGSENGSIVTPGDADNSLMAEMIVSQEMPKRGPKLTPPQVQTIIDWINQGALDN
jgi:uncharacterized membrane protein